MKKSMKYKFFFPLIFAISKKNDEKKSPSIIFRTFIYDRIFFYFFFCSGVYGKMNHIYDIQYVRVFHVEFFSAWHRVNFADFNPIYKQIFMWSIILICSITFAFSPVIFFFFVVLFCFVFFSL